jgi:hypothetical protein
MEAEGFHGACHRARVPRGPLALPFMRLNMVLLCDGRKRSLRMGRRAVVSERSGFGLVQLSSRYTMTR